MHKYKGNSTSNDLSAFIIRNGWESKIGLEVHAQIDTRSKLFSSTGTKYGSPANTRVSLFDAGIPGTLPVINKKCVEAAVLTALALSCHINELSRFDRKHYFYADLPTGYQITQQRQAIANDGNVSFVVYSPSLHKEPYYRKCNIHQIQLEQDSGKSIHDTEGERSLIDLNRAGLPLMEIVFEPDLMDGEEAGALVKELILILTELGTCNCKMEEGSLRVDVNISVNRIGEELGVRTEIKNLNTNRAIVNAIESEVNRQIQAIENGDTIINETRSYDAESKTTVPMRDKEVKQDYRFMPEPNLPPLRVTSDLNQLNIHPHLVNIELLKNKLAQLQLPQTKREKLVKNFGMRMETAITILNTPGLLPYFESVIQLLHPEYGVRAIILIQSVLLAALSERDLTLEDSSIQPQLFAELFKLIESGLVNISTAQHVVGLILNGDKRSPIQIVDEDGLIQVTDDKRIEAVCLEIMSLNPKIVSKYQNTHHIKHVNKLMGEIRKATEGKYDMKKVDECLRKLLNKK